MSYERDSSTSDVDQRPNAAADLFAPGKSNLADGASQRKANGRGAVGPGKLTLTGSLDASRGQGRGQPDGAAAQRDVGVAESRDLVLDDGLEDPAMNEPARPVDGRITTPGPGGGANVAATVVGATAETELARDGGLTPAIIAALHANPDLSIDEILQHIAAYPIGNEGGGRAYQHPTIVQYGRMAQGGAGAAGATTGEPSKKQAVLIANENYENVPNLHTPLIEANQLQGELSSRGYGVDIHSDKTAADMASLWNAMIGAAKPGDDLVAHYGGHGIVEGLVGIKHDRPPEPPDLFTNAQVSGVVSAATGKGAHIRFILDSCHSGAAVQAVREVRQNELAAAATSTDDKPRVEALASLRDMKRRLLAIREQRTTGAAQVRAALDQLNAAPPDPGNAEAAKKWTKIQGTLRDVVVVWSSRHDSEEEKLWTEMIPQLEVIRTMAKYPTPPPPFSSYDLGPQLNYLDDLWNAVSQPVEDSLARPGGAAQPAGAAQPSGATPPAAK